MLALLRKSIAGSGFSTLLAAQPLRCWDGTAELVIPLSAQLTQHHGYAHGAVVGAAADNACAWAAASVAGDVLTSSYSVHLLALARGERLRAVGKSSTGADDSSQPAPRYSPKTVARQRW